MNIFDERRAELERYEFMMGAERGRLAVALDLLTDSLIMVGQHGVDSECDGRDPGAAGGGAWGRARCGVDSRDFGVD